MSYSTLNSASKKNNTQTTPSHQQFYPVLFCLRMANEYLYLRIL